MKTAIKTAINAAINATLKTTLKTLACALLALADLAAPAHAQAVDCVVNPNGYNVDFGIYQGNGTAAASPGAWRFVCKNGTPQPLNVKICVGLGEGSMGMLGNMRRMRNAPGDSLRYQLYRDPAASQPYALPPDDDNNGIQVIATLPPMSETSIETSFRIIGRIPAGQTVPTGVYESKFAGTQIRIRFRPYGVTDQEPPCISPIQHNVSFGVRAQVLPFCQLSIGLHVDFGSRTENEVTGGLLSGGKLEFWCSPGLDYSIAMDDGGNPQGNLRRMEHISGDTHTVQYQLCHDFNCTQRWGSHPQERKHGTGIGGLQGYEIIGRVPPGQTVTAVGAYKDKVVVTVHY